MRPRGIETWAAGGTHRRVWSGNGWFLHAVDGIAVSRTEAGGHWGGEGPQLSPLYRPSDEEAVHYPMTAVPSQTIPLSVQMVPPTRHN